MVNWTIITTTAQFRDRDEKEGRTVIGTETEPLAKKTRIVWSDIPHWLTKSLDHYVKKKEENPELLQQGIIEVNQASQQEGTLEDHATM